MATIRGFDPFTRVLAINFPAKEFLAVKVVGKVSASAAQADLSTPVGGLNLVSGVVELPTDAIPHLGFPILESVSAEMKRHFQVWKYETVADPVVNPQNMTCLAIVNLPKVPKPWRFRVSLSNLSVQAAPNEWLNWEFRITATYGSGLSFVAADGTSLVREETFSVGSRTYLGGDSTSLPDRAFTISITGQRVTIG